MYSNEDLERFYFRYQAEALPHGTSLQAFCLNNNVPYNIFSKWYKDTRRKVVEVQVQGRPSSECQSEEIQPVQAGNGNSLFEKKFVAGHQFMKVVKENGENVYRIDWKDVVLLLENPIVKSLKIR